VEKDIDVMTKNSYTKYMKSRKQPSLRLCDVGRWANICGKVEIM